MAARIKIYCPPGKSPCKDTKVWVNDQEVPGLWSIEYTQTATGYPQAILKVHVDAADIETEGEVSVILQPAERIGGVGPSYTLDYVRNQEAHNKKQKTRRLSKDD